MAKAKISLSDLAPKDAKRFGLGPDDIEVPYETDNPRIIASAHQHPWLSVEVETVDPVASFPDPKVDPATDPFLAENTKAFDVEEAPKVEEFTPVAIEAGRDQSEVVEGDIAVTLASDPEAAKRPARKTGKE